MTWVLERIWDKQVRISVIFPKFLTKKSTPHLRQIIEFQMPHGVEGEVKDNYKIVDKYRELVKEVLKEIGEEI